MPWGCCSSVHRRGPRWWFRGGGFPSLCPTALQHRGVTGTAAAPSRAAGDITAHTDISVPNGDMVRVLLAWPGPVSSL